MVKGWGFVNDNLEILCIKTKEGNQKCLELVPWREADPKEVINGMLSEAARYIACMTADSDTTETAVVGLFKTYVKMHREELKKGNNQ